MKQSKKIFIAITGGIGSGKSSVLNIIREMGYSVFSADAIASNIYDDEQVLMNLKSAFPECFTEGRPDRKKLASIVFSDHKKLELLNDITHPKIMEKLFYQMQSATGKIIFAEVPLLFEGGYEKLFDKVLVVMRPLAERISSVCKRDGITEQEVLSRIKNQYDYEKNTPVAHTLIYNTGNISQLYIEVKNAIEQFEKDI